MTPRTLTHSKWFALTLFALTGCRAEPPPPLTAEQWVAAMHRTIGPSIDSIASIAVDAMVEGPQGQFVTLVHSASDGRVSLDLAGMLVAGVGSDGAWQCSAIGQRIVPDSATLSMVRGHDLHMLVLRPSWLGGPTLDSTMVFGEDSVATLRFTDQLGAPLLMFLGRTDSLPLALQLVNHSGQGPRDVVVELDDWEMISGLRLFTQATFLHGASRYVYNYRDIEINQVADSTFAPSCQ
jgi:hypothetical protein